MNTYETHILDLLTSYDPVSCIGYDLPILIDETDLYNQIVYRD